MAEQTEIKKVISVDLGNTTTSLKEYKKHIDELRGSLLQLDESSEDYAKIAQEISVEQEKLNEVMKVGKQSTDAAEGSYNQLAQTMAELKKQWKATGDEVERNELGSKILDINNQLKELDASTGNYQRNVGDYANAFEQAFGKCLDGIQTLDGPLGEIGRMTKQLIPVIKAVNSTAVAGLSGVKKAIASTGIGLLIVAVGELAAHWEDIKKLVGDMIGVQDTYTAAVKASEEAMEALKKEVKAANDEIKFQTNLMAAQGATRLEQLNAELVDEKKIVDDLWKQYYQKIDFYNLYKDAGAKSQRKAAELRKQEADAIYEQIQAQEEQVKKTQQNIQIQEATLEKAAQDRIKSIEESLQTEEQRLKTQYDKDLALAEQYGLDTVAITQKYEKDLAALRAKATKEKTETKTKEKDILLEQETKQVEAILDTLHKSTTDQLTLLRERYEKELELLKKYGKDTTDYTQWYENEVVRIRQEATDKAVDKEIEDYIAKQEREAEQLEFENELSAKTYENKVQQLDENERIAQREHEIAQQLLQDKIDFLAAELEEYEGTVEAKLALEEELNKYKQEYDNNDRLRAKETAEYKEAREKEAANNAKVAWQSAASSVANILGSLADLMEEGSEEQKALMIMETTINTLSGAIAAYQAMAGIPYVGPVLGAAAAAAVGIAGAANIAKIKSTTKSSGGSADVATPSVQSPDMTSVSPLLDEVNDINRMTTLNEQGDSTKEQQNLRVYVVDQDIRDANHKAEVVESSVTF